MLAVISWRNGEEIRAESIEEADGALDEIEAICDRSLPPVVLVDRDQYGCMDIRLGHPMSALHHVPADGNPPYMITIGQNPDDQRETDFWYFTHHTPAIGRHLVDLADARRGMRWFLERGTLAPFLTWEAV